MANILKLHTTVQIYDTVNLEFDLPYYCKTEDCWYKIITPEKALRLTNSSLIITNPQHKHSAIEIAKAVAVTENEFDTMAYMLLMESEEIIKNKPSRYSDVNEEIDMMREREMERRAS